MALSALEEEIGERILRQFGGQLQRVGVAAAGDIFDVAGSLEIFAGGAGEIAGEIGNAGIEAARQLQILIALALRECDRTGREGGVDRARDFVADGFGGDVTEAVSTAIHAEESRNVDVEELRESGNEERV